MTTIQASKNYEHIALNSGSIEISGAGRFDSAEASGSIALFTTNLNGVDPTFAVNLYDGDEFSTRATPITTKNFLDYINNGKYVNTIIHRSIPDFVIQGGGFSAPTLAADQPGSDPTAVQSELPITNEPGNSNTRGTIAMAKLGGLPDSATNQWYINIKDNLFLDTDNGGYTVFGEVIGNGLDVIDIIAGTTTYDAAGYYGNAAFSDLPLWNVNADNIVRPEDFIVIKNIQVVDESSLFEYSVKSSDPEALQASIDTQGNVNLVLIETRDEHITIEVTAKERYGTESLTEAFLVTTATAYRYEAGGNTSELTSIWLDNTDKSSTQEAEPKTTIEVAAAGWSQILPLAKVVSASNTGSQIIANQLDITLDTEPNDQNIEITTSLLEGSEQSDILRGLAGWDILDGKGGDDLLHGGKGRDILSGGSGSDELHGDFGWNTYTDQADGFVDLIAIKSDQFLVNWWYGRAGNSPNGEKADIIEKLDANDQIKIIGVATDRLSFSSASAHDQNGIGIFADGVLEALYTGGDLSAAQLSSMTTGDASDVAMNNQIWSYNFGNDIPSLL